MLGRLLYNLGTENGGLVFVLAVRVSGVRLVSWTLRFFVVSVSILLLLRHTSNLEFSIFLIASAITENCCFHPQKKLQNNVTYFEEFDH